MVFRVTALGCISGLLFCYQSLAQPFTGFRGIGDLPGGDFASAISGISPHGNWLVGGSIGENGVIGFRLPLGGQMIPLPTGPGGLVPIAAEDVTDSGVVAGYGSRTAAPGDYEPYRYDPASGLQSLGSMNGATYGLCFATSGDGKVIVGSGNSGNGSSEAFRWTAATGRQGIGSAPGGESFAMATGISGDGSTIVGLGSAGSQVGGYRWTAADGAQLIPGTPGVIMARRAYAASYDGSIIVGEGVSPAGTRPFWWSATLGMRDLGLAPGMNFASVFDCTDDGLAAVGYGGVSGVSFEACIWREGIGMRTLKDYFQLDLGANLTGWRLREAWVSGDGRVFGGSAFNPAGQFEGWVFVVPEPEVTALVSSIATALLGRGRKRERRA